MTVTYNSTGYMRPFGFCRLLFRWSASIWKAIWIELAIWLAIYYVIMIIYWSLPSDNKRTFEKLVLDWEQYNTTSTTVITFALGFYVTQSFERWWSCWNNIPWIDPLAHAVNGGVRNVKSKSSSSADDEEKMKIVRRTIVRYANLASALVFQTTSERIGSELKGARSLIDPLGLATEEEVKMLPCF
eukprot:g4899.t1